MKLVRSFVASSLLCAASWAAAANFKIVLLVPANDERLSRNRIERATPGQPTGRTQDALALALSENFDQLKAANIHFSLDVKEVADADAIKKLANSVDFTAATAIFTDLSEPMTLQVAQSTKLPVLNLSAAQDSLRGEQCKKNLWHVAPSERMRADALAQSLVARKWSKILLLTGPSAEDAQRSAVVQASIKRYGLKLVQTKPFKLSADPRERDLANPLLLTQGEYDAVWVVDSDGEFAQSLPYRTALPRPVVGDAGLMALAWHSRYERYGAPQVVRRMLKAHGRRMEAHDWAAWMAARVLIEAAQQAVKTKPKAGSAEVEKALSTVQADGSKGVLLSFRPWDGQLRQPMLLTDGITVLGSAPIEGILHPRDVLDTLGADAPEKLCKGRL